MRPNLYPSTLLDGAGAAIRWAGRLAAPSTIALPRMMPVEKLPPSARDDIAFPTAEARRASDEATLSEALGQTNHW
jgi:hypothetical protein